MFASRLAMSFCGCLVLFAACGGGASTPGGSGGGGGSASGGSDGGGGRTDGSGSGSGGAAGVDGGGQPDTGARADTGAGSDAAVSLPVAQCRQFVSKMCNRISTTCADSFVMPNEATCNRQNLVFVGCDRASEPFADCLAAFDRQTCDEFAPPEGGVLLPGSCELVIGNIPPSEAQTKCRGLIRTLCERALRCGISDEPVEDCAPRVEATELTCRLAGQVSPTYDRCIQDIKASACPPPGGAASDPPSCTQVVGIVGPA